MSGRSVAGGKRSFAVALGLLAAATLALIVLGLTGDIRRGPVLVLLAAALGAGSVALFGWGRAARAAAGASRAADDRIARLEEAKRASAEALERAVRGRREEHEWNRKLRTQVLELQRQRGVLGDTHDTAALVLRTAIELTGAQKGLLLSREDLDHDRDLDMVIADGFEHDPTHSAVAQRFAERVLRADETIREDDLQGATSPPDQEITNLVAIPIYMRDRFHGVVICCNKPGGFHDYEDDVLLALGNHAGVVLHNAHLHGALRSAYLSTVGVLADAVAVRDPSLRTHADQVARHVATVADRLGIEPVRREQLVFASLLHDVGKIGISERILLKPGPLDEEERRIIELHPLIGYSLVKEVPALAPVASVLLHHHERWDGAGYPQGTKGEATPLESRIIAVADSFGAMTAARPYRERMRVDEACEELERCAGSQFDPDVVRLFVSEVRRNPAALEPDISRELNDLLGGRRDGEVALLGFGSYAVVDNLTLLYSHRHLHEVARAEARRGEDRGRPFAVLLVKLADLDRLNRESGFPAGDEAIQHVARILERIGARAAGTAARYSGACLALLVPGADEPIGEQLAAELAKELEGGPHVRVAYAAWGPGDSGGAVIRRARSRLGSAAGVAG